jgi:5-methylcytosine-specific restriction endonuclease McrA
VDFNLVAYEGLVWEDRRPAQRRARRSAARRAAKAAAEGRRVENVLDEAVCHYCGRETAVEFRTRDHIVARSAGGRGRDNLVMACRPCNVEKGNRPSTCECPICEAARNAV